MKICENANFRYIDDNNNINKYVRPKWFINTQKSVFGEVQMSQK